jgi:hypothetical protein
MDYYKFKNLEDCQNALEAINRKKNWGENKGTTTWANPHKNQVSEEYIIPFDNNQIGDCIDLLKDGELVSKEQAITEGWYFGFFTGTFAREREKLEDIHFIFDALIASYGKPNFPATRALVLSFLSACYSLKESLSKKIKPKYFESDFIDWWKIKKEQQNKKNELLKEYHVFMNTEKHGGAFSGQRSVIKLEPRSHLSGLKIENYHPHSDPRTMIISSEGAFMTAYSGTSMERRFPVGIHDAKYEIRVINAPEKHLGENIKGATFLDQMSLIKE